MRLGRWGITAAAVAVLTVAGTGVATGLPAASAGRNRDGFRDQNRDRSYETREAGNSQAPARFVAEYAGYVVIVSAETGRAERVLAEPQAGGGAARPAVSPDGRTVWFSRTDGTCAAHLASVAVTGGKEEKLPGSGDAGAETVPLPRPGRPQLAYARVDCAKPNASLIVGDLEGIEGHGQSGLVPLAWSRDGDHLLARTLKDETRLVDVNPTGGIASSHAVAPADSVADCRLEVVGFSPDDNDGYVALRRCGKSGDQGRRSLVLLDKDGNLRKTVLRLSRSQDFTDRPAFDPSGHSLLFATVPAEADGVSQEDQPVSLWLWRDGETRRLQRQTGYRHPAWLP